MSHDRFDSSDAPHADADITDAEILAFIARIQNGSGRRQYLATRRPGESAGESQ